MTPQEFVTELTMSYSSNKSDAILVVEGDADKKLFEQLFKPSHRFSIVPTGGRDLVLDVLSVINAGGANKLPPVCGIVDQDYSVPLQHPPTPQQVFSSDLRDVECMMIASNAFLSVANEFVDQNKLAKFCVGFADLRNQLIEICKEVGALRYWSQANNKKISFQQLDLSKCIDTVGTIKLNRQKFITHLQGAQKGLVVTLTDLNAARTSCNTEPHFKVALMLCRGHDLMSAFAVLLRKCVGNNGSQGIDGESLERIFRPAFPAHWMNYSLINSIRSWVTTLGFAAELT